MAVAPHLRRKLCHRTAEETSVIVRLPKSLAVVVVAGAVLALSLSSGAPPVHATALSTGVGRGAWAQVAELAGPPTAFGDGFGGSVAVSGDGHSGRPRHRNRIRPGLRLPPEHKGLAPGGQARWLQYCRR